MSTTQAAPVLKGTGAALQLIRQNTFQRGLLSGQRDRRP